MNTITIILDSAGNVLDVRLEGMGTTIRVLGPGGKLKSEKTFSLVHGRIDFFRVKPFEFYFEGGKYCVKGPEGIEEFTEYGDASDKFREYIRKVEGENGG